jgi:hypothetical protein
MTDTLSVERITEFGDFLYEIANGNMHCSHETGMYDHTDELGFFASFFDKHNDIDHTVAAKDGTLLIHVVDRRPGGRTYNLVFQYKEGTTILPEEAKHYLEALADNMVC